MNREALFTARWHLLNGKAVPTGAPLSELLALMEPVLGKPNLSLPANGINVAPKPDGSLVVEWHNDDLPPIRDVIWLVPPGQRFPIVGVPFTLEQFRGYLAGIKDEQMSWSPTGVTIHHTAAPSLAQRPRGFESQHMLNLRSYYTSLGWDRGPHLFVDDSRIWVFSPLTARAIHAVSFNSRFFGIEMLGDFDREDPKSGRGAKVTELGAAAAVELIARFGLSEATKFHRDDPKTDKTCPGKLISRDWFYSLMGRAADAR